MSNTKSFTSVFDLARERARETETETQLTENNSYNLDTISILRNGTKSENNTNQSERSLLESGDRRDLSKTAAVTTGHNSKRILGSMDNNEIVIHNGVELSGYQVTVRKHIHRIKVRTQRPHFICPSVAGSGKSWTLKMCVREVKNLYRRDKILVLQFNKHIAEATAADLGELPGVDVRTNHSAGNAVFRLNGYKTTLDKNKYFGICKAIIEKNYGALMGASAEDGGFELEQQIEKDSKKKEKKGRKILQLTISLVDLMEMCQNTLTDPTKIEKLHKMAGRHEMAIAHSGLFHLVNEAIDEGIAQFEQHKIISYGDMLYLPLMLQMEFPQYDWVLCDECQDFNKAQLNIVLAHVKQGGGTVGAFGDEWQSIMGWAGAMPDSIERYVKRTNARTLPLSICYRCPAKVLELARMIVPHIEQPENCEPGEVNAISFWQIINTAKAGDYILCRLTAPLVKSCIEFIKQGIRAKVKGREIGSKIKGMYQSCVDAGGDDIKTIDQFIGFLREHRARERKAGIQKKMSDAKLAQQDDYFSCIHAIAEYISNRIDYKTKIRGGLGSHKAIVSQISYMFDEAVPSDFITLCTVHRAKGLETDNVFIIDFDKMPFKPGNKKKGGMNEDDEEIIESPVFTKDALRQEMNVLYVALTRPRKKLYISGASISCYEDIVTHIWNWVNNDHALRGIKPLPEPECLRKEREKRDKQYQDDAITVTLSSQLTEIEGFSEPKESDTEIEMSDELKSYLNREYKNTNENEFQHIESVPLDIETKF